MKVHHVEAAMRVCRRFSSIYAVLALVLSIATVLSLAGSAIVSYRYLRRAEWASVH